MGVEGIDGGDVHDGSEEVLAHVLTLAGVEDDQGLESNDAIAFLVVVGQHAGAVFGVSEPGAMAERITPEPEFVESPAEVGPDSMGNPAVLLQELA